MQWKLENLAKLSAEKRAELSGIPPQTAVPGLVKSSQGNGGVSQLDRFLPRCPITARYKVIPASYEKRLMPVHPTTLSLTKPLRGCVAY